MDNLSIKHPEFVKRMIVDAVNTTELRTKFLRGETISPAEMERLITITPTHPEITWGPNRFTMIPWTALEHVQSAIINTVKSNVPGDFVETGAWRGGTCILARSIYADLGEKRKVFVVDSFEGLPPPDPSKYPDDKGDTHFQDPNMVASLEMVQENFRKFGLLDDQVVFIKGWFKDTVPTAPIDKISILRLDGDMYESTIDVLVYLYHKLSIGGYLIIDDYQHPACRSAIRDFRAKHGITENIVKVDNNPLNEVHYWIKQKATKFVPVDQQAYPKRGFARFTRRVSNVISNLVKK